MKKVLLFVGLSIAMVSCVQTPIEGSNVVGEIGSFSIVVIDGCEYLEYRRGNGNTAVYSLTHKGNCKNHEKF